MTTGRYTESSREPSISPGWDFKTTQIAIVVSCGKRDLRKWGKKEAIQTKGAFANDGAGLSHPKREATKKKYRLWIDSFGNTSRLEEQHHLNLQFQPLVENDNG